MVWRCLCFATREEVEAKANIQDLMMHWFDIGETRIVESGRLENLTSEAETPAQ
jgi:hypothetical protein